MTLGLWVVVGHAVATLVMVGLIWFVQVVHYPLFAKVGNGAFSAYHTAHMRLTTYVVGPPMLFEVAATIALFVIRPPALPLWWIWLGAVLLAGVWLTTTTLSVPYHHKMARGFDARTVKLLVRTNWIRTILWTARGVVSVLMVNALVK